MMKSKTLKSHDGKISCNQKSLTGDNLKGWFPMTAKFRLCNNSSCISFPLLPNDHECGINDFCAIIGSHDFM